MKNIWNLFLLFALLSAQTSYAHPESNSGIVGPPYEEIENELINLEQSYPDIAKRIVYGITPQGRNLNILRIARMDPTEFTGDAPAIVITGSIHGNEYLGFEEKLPRFFLEQVGDNDDMDSFLERGGIIYIAPVINPDGYEAGTRENSRSKDLNRDFPNELKHHAGFEETESKDLYDFLTNDFNAMQVYPLVTFDYHCCIGALFYPWSFEPPTVSDEEAARLLEIGNLFLYIFEGYDYSTTPTMGGYSAVGTFKDALFERYRSYSYTFEGVYKEEKDNYHSHQEFWLEILYWINWGII